MLTGEVKFFLDAKNYGFITPHGEGKDVMFHRSALQGVQTIKEGQWVTFSEVLETPRGPKALRVELCKKRGEHENSREREMGKVVSFGTD